MQRRGDRIDVLADLRSLQDPLYAGRGIGSHAEFLLATLRDRGSASLRLVGLVDPTGAPPAPGVAAACDELRPVFAADAAARSVFLALSPMTHDTRPPARLLDRADVRAAAIVYDFIPLEFPERYLESRAALYRYAAASLWLGAHEAFFPISHHAAEELTHRHAIEASRIDVTGVALRDAFARRLAGGGARRPAAAADDAVLFIGGPDERKNLDAAVAAFVTLRAEGRPTLQLAVAGGYPQDWRERVRARCGHAAAGILFLDRLSDDELADWHAHARATVIASRAEGFSLPVIECIASGGLAVASDIPVHRELLADPGLRFDPDRPDQLAAILGRVIGTTGERSRLAAGQRATATRFTAAAVGDRFWNAFSARFLPARIGGPAPRRRRSIAFVTPFPPDRTGVADYSLRCVEALARHVDVDVYTDQPQPTVTAAVRQFHPITAAAWLRPDYDATIAVVGNSSFHTRIIELHRRFGGPCIVHDNRLAELTAWWKGPEHLRSVAERTLGRGVRPEEVSGWLADPGGLPTLFYDEILDAARPLLVHSRGIQEHVRRLERVEADYLPFCVYRRFTGADISADARCTARRALGVPDDEAMIVTLGIVDAVKSPAVCVDAVAALVRRGIPARLHFVGECSDPTREALEQRAREAGIGGRLAFTAGWLDEAGYRRFVVAADAGVQLRNHFFGGLSGALMDCVAAGLPTVANDDLAAAVEAPAYVARVPDRPSPEAVAAGLEACLTRGADRSRHEPAREAFAAAHGFDAYARALLDAVFDRPRGRSADATVTSGKPVPGASPRVPRVFVDASYTGSAPAHSGVARVVTRTSESISDVAARRGWTAHRVAAREGRFVVTDDADAAVPVRFSRDDILLLPDAYWAFPDVWPAVERARVAGAMAVPLVYDLIPLKHPEIYGIDGARLLRRYLDAVMRHADLVATISTAVAEELAAETRGDRFLRSGPAILPWRLGCDLPATDGCIRDGVAKLFRDRLPDSAYLVLGALEPRKNHAFILDAFRRLWADPATAHVKLAIMGRPGHAAAGILRAIRSDRRFGDRLVLLDDCDDAEVDHAYRHARGLVFASIAEGFGLPLVEALRHGQTVFASDLPIHREVGVDDCRYFALDSAAALADLLRDHEAEHAGRGVPRRVVRQPLTWTEAAAHLLDAVIARRDAGPLRHAG